MPSFACVYECWISLKRFTWASEATGKDSESETPAAVAVPMMAVEVDEHRRPQCGRVRRTESPLAIPRSTFDAHDGIIGVDRDWRA